MANIYDSGIASASSGADADIKNSVIITGSAIWVDSANGNDSNAGTEEAPLATISQAATNATANNGDVIVIKSGHEETLTSSQALSKAGVRIFGLGSGTNRPSFTVNGNVDMFSISAVDVEINNLYFPVGTNAHTSRINIAAARALIKNCGFACGANDVESITLTGVAGVVIDNCSFTVSADGPDAAIEVESASALGLQITNCSFDGGTVGFDAGAINSGVAHTEFHYDSITLTNFADIVHSAAAKGMITNWTKDASCKIQVS